MRLHVRHNLNDDELTRAVVALAKSHGIGEAVVGRLQKSSEMPPVEPRFPAMKGLFTRFNALYPGAIEWIQDIVERATKCEEIRKAKGYLDRPLTKKEIARIQQAIRDRFRFVAAQMESDFRPSGDLLRRWKAWGLIDKDITPATFIAQVSTEGHLIKNAFVFGRLHQAVEAGTSYAEVLKLALEMPLLKPDIDAILVAEQQTANYITALGDDVAATFGTMAVARNRDIIRQMAVDFHRQDLRAQVVDETVKRELGETVAAPQVTTWQGFSSELYHAMEDKARDWQRIAFYELQDAKAQGQGMAMLRQYGPEQLVYKMPLPTACPQCRELYLQEDGVTPRLFRLGALLANGNNIGRKPMPVRDGRVAGHERTDGEETLKAVCGQIHPWCQCQGVYAYTSLEPWADYYKVRR